MRIIISLALLRWLRGGRAIHFRCAAITNRFRQPCASLNARLPHERYIDGLYSKMDYSLIANDEKSIEYVAQAAKTTAPADSHIITDYSTKGALPSLTLEIERDPVQSGRYGRS